MTPPVLHLMARRQYDILRVLSDRQYDVLRLAALGMSYHAIGVELGIHESTVKNHVMAVYRKADGHCLVDALRAAGWLEVPAA